MAYKELSKHDLARKEEILAKVRKLHSMVNTNIALVNNVIERYIEALNEMKGFVEDINSAQEDYWNDRTERWQDSDAGQDYSSWKDEWGTFYFDEPQLIEELEDVADQMDNLPIGV
jgi:hypothetical protein